MKIIKVKITNFTLIATLFVFCGCSKDKLLKQKQQEDSQNPIKRYEKALKNLKEDNYIIAGEEFEKIDEDFPFSKIAKKANIMAVYCYYQEKKYDKIIEITDNFMQINSGDSINTPYMLYMKGIVYYNQISGPFLSEDYANKASIVFRELRARFPTSIYRQDIENKLINIDENIAGRKMNIARYQMKNLNIIGAINNFLEVIYYHQFSKQVPEAYFRLMEINKMMGIEYPEDISKILYKNYPQSFWNHQKV
ncbi:MAG: outer membrane protein assembly factor BamD [Rickettsiales bacterium]|jgi:outer membrane protein assembly factor BamD|nr:outer membrane protein assembly factor BamD [Rickettsiales bacterium]